MADTKRQLPVHCKKIKIALISNGMTQRELAKAVGMNENYLTDVLAGRKPGKKYMHDIGNILNIEL